MNHDYDAIIVGGRVAGSHLAARLGKYGFRVLLLERAEFPSLPAVSSPIIYSSTMRLLDEIGADESAYARNTPKLHDVMSVAGGFPAAINIPDYKGRDYAYAIDRARFDAALWDTAIGYENVTGQQNFSVTDLLWDGDTVIGVIGKDKNGEEVQFTASIVIGADGRFGIVSRKVGAEEKDRYEEYPTSIYYAYWKNVAYLDDKPTASTYEGDGYGYLVMDSADGQTVIAVEGRSDVVEPDAGKIEQFYRDIINKHPELAKRTHEAEPVTTVRGMRNIGNSYRQPGGKGWALVGDAYHQKDPLDGQGIYNAVITGKILARQMLKWNKGDISWDEAIEEYDELSRMKTYGMYKSLQTSIRRNFYGESDIAVPEWAQEQLARWLLDDEQFKDLIGKMLIREVPADYVNLMTPPMIFGAIARGIGKDIEKRVKKRIPFLK